MAPSANKTKILFQMWILPLGLGASPGVDVGPLLRA